MFPLTDRRSFGVIADVVPRDLIDEALVDTGKRAQWKRLLPAHVMVARFCLAICLPVDDDYRVG